MPKEKDRSREEGTLSKVASFVRLGMDPREIDSFLGFLVTGN